jgi:trafficking protein particle complex subunit 11
LVRLSSNPQYKAFHLFTDDPGLDARLTFLRRQSALDARAALFVLSPVNNTELQDFIHRRVLFIDSNVTTKSVRSLTEALREPSIEYYTAHSKRVRRKRNRHASSAYSGYPTSALATTRAVPLRPIGWTVRYEYKLGTFAEFRFEEEVARK